MTIKVPRIKIAQVRN